MRFPKTVGLVFLLGASAAAAAACGADDSGFGVSGGGRAIIDSGADVPTLPVADAGSNPETGTPERDDFASPVVDPGTPANAPQLFDVADVSGAGACLLEPQVGSLIPKNWQRLRFRQKGASSENLFEILVKVPNQKSPLRIYTTKESYTLDAATWNALRTSAAVAGPNSVSVRIRSAVVDGSGVLTGGPWTGSQGSFEIAPVDLTGTLSYWTEGALSSIRKLRVSDESTTSGPSSTDTGGACIGCHTPTPDGVHAAYTLNGGGGGLKMLPLGGGTTAPAYLSANASTLLARTNQFTAAFSKAHWTAGDRVAVTVLTSGQATEMIWTDLEATSAGTGTFARTGDSGNVASPAVSHDGTKIVYTSTNTTTNGMTSTAAKIALIPWNNRAGGTSATLVGNTALNYYPSFSADDTLVSFARTASGTTYDNPNAEVHVVHADGSVSPHRLAANDPPTCSGLASPGLKSSWPRWSPEVKTVGTRKFYFLAFSSARGATAGVPQIYVAPVVMEGATVTSYPALYLWSQDSAVRNHTPSWSEPL
jgi:hypothetical protein